MTSSLVGSEMCIRDSGYTSTQNGRLRREYAGSLARRRPYCCMAEGAGTVSYTHLTLPTICSV
eukprot:3342387-Prorocentrum_lima.AAC.1